MHSKPEGQSRTRWAEAEYRTKKPPKLPDIGEGEYIVMAWFNLGKAPGGNPLSWCEIEAYARVTREIGTPWEAQLLRQMSCEYLDGLSIGRDPLAIEPWSQEYG